MEYNFTGKNKKGVNQANEIYLSLFGAKELSDNLRFGVGLTDLIKENDYHLKLRLLGRYTISKNLHFELMGDLSLFNKNIPKSNDVGLFLRYNF